MMEPEKEVKPCRKCGARDRNKFGRCRPCQLKRGTKYRQKNREKVREVNRRYREENRDKVREADRRYREENRQKERERERRYREANREKVRVRKRHWRERNPEKTREASRRYYEANPDKVRETHRNNNHTRRARKKNPNYPNDRLSRGLKGKLMKLQKGKCAYANAPLAHWCAIDIRKENHMDHIMPLALDGRNIDSNMQLTCPACNLRKGDSHPDDFARRVGLIV